MAGEPVAARSVALGKVYGRRDTAVAALRSVTLEFPVAEFAAVMGPSGSGKSTLLHCLAALDTPSSGAVFLGDIDISSLSHRERAELRRDRIGFVFQAFNLVPTLTARENITLPQLLAGRNPDRRWLAAVVDQVGLRDRLSHRPAELSGGQQQRVAVARALAGRPEIIFADEPTGNLDTRAGHEVLSLLRSAVDDHGQTIVMVTHDPMAASYADRVVFLGDGSVVDELRDPTADRVLERLKSLSGEPAPQAGRSAGGAAGRRRAPAPVAVPQRRPVRDSGAGPLRAVGRWFSSRALAGRGEREDGQVTGFFGDPEPPLERTSRFPQMGRDPRQTADVRPLTAPERPPRAERPSRAEPAGDEQGPASSRAQAEARLLAQVRDLWDEPDERVLALVRAAVDQFPAAARADEDDMRTRARTRRRGEEPDEVIERPSPHADDAWLAALHPITPVTRRSEPALDPLPHPRDAAADVRRAHLADLAEASRARLADLAVDVRRAHLADLAEASRARLADLADAGRARRDQLMDAGRAHHDELLHANRARRDELLQANRARRDEQVDTGRPGRGEQVDTGRPGRGELTDAGSPAGSGPVDGADPRGQAERAPRGIPYRSARRAETVQWSPSGTVALPAAAHSLSDDARAGAAQVRDGEGPGRVVRRTPPSARERASERFVQRRSVPGDAPAAPPPPPPPRRPAQGSAADSASPDPVTSRVPRPGSDEDLGLAGATGRASRSERPARGPEPARAGTTSRTSGPAQPARERPTAATAGDASGPHADDRASGPEPAPHDDPRRTAAPTDQPRPGRTQEPAGRTQEPAARTPAGSPNGRPAGSTSEAGREVRAYPARAAAERLLAEVRARANDDPPAATPPRPATPRASSLESDRGSSSRPPAPKVTPADRSATPDTRPSPGLPAPNRPPAGRQAASDSPPPGRQAASSGPPPGRQAGPIGTPASRSAAASGAPASRPAAANGTTASRPAAAHGTPVSRPAASNGEPVSGSVASNGGPAVANGAPAGRAAAVDGSSRAGGVRGGSASAATAGAVGDGAAKRGVEVEDDGFLPPVRGGDAPQADAVTGDNGGLREAGPSRSSRR